MHVNSFIVRTSWPAFGMLKTFRWVCLCSRYMQKGSLRAPETTQYQCTTLLWQVDQSSASSCRPLCILVYTSYFHTRHVSHSPPSLPPRVSSVYPASNSLKQWLLLTNLRTLVRHFCSTLRLCILVLEWLWGMQGMLHDTVKYFKNRSSAWQLGLLLEGVLCPLGTNDWNYRTSPSLLVLLEAEYTVSQVLWIWASRGDTHYKGEKDGIKMKIGQPLLCHC